MNPACEPLLDTWQPSRTQALFMDLTFNQEFGQSADRLRKWQGPIRIYMQGEASSETRMEIDSVIEQLAALSSSIPIETVSQAAQGNLELFLGEKEDYVALIEPLAAGIAEGNSGFATIAWNDEFEIIRASVCLDVVNFPDPALQRHVIREELAQALGLINDTELEEESMFHQFIDTATAYSELDRLMIQYMLGSELQAGMCPREVLEVVD